MLCYDLTVPSDDIELDVIRNSRMLTMYWISGIVSNMGQSFTRVGRGMATILRLKGPVLLYFEGRELVVATTLEVCHGIALLMHMRVSDIPPLSKIHLLATIMGRMHMAYAGYGRWFYGAWYLLPHPDWFTHHLAHPLIKRTAEDIGDAWVAFLRTQDAYSFAPRRAYGVHTMIEWMQLDALSRSRPPSAAARVNAGPSRSECCICMENDRNAVFTSCGHMCVCVECGTKCRGVCPVCRAPGSAVRVLSI